MQDSHHEHAPRPADRELLSTVAHELRTPVAAVRGAAAALRSAEALEPETRQRLLDVIARAADQLARLADDLLAASRDETGRLEVVVAPCDVAAVAQEVVEAARVATPAASIRLQVSAVGPAAADAGRLRQVLANLVENAVVHGGAEVEVAVAEVAEGVTVSVSDRGPGIPAAEHERIFEPFERLADRGVPGTGLGLHLARELVAAMEGTLTISSAQGSGATFTVSLRRA